MEVTAPNDVKIYNLSKGKSIPDWISAERARKLKKTDSGYRQSIELLQDYNMPTVCEQIKVSPNAEYVIASGTYKPRIKCYELSQLGMKFERCFDSDVIDFLYLSDDFSKLAFLCSDRYLEFHVQYGKYYRLRVPRFGRGLAFNEENSELYVVGDGAEVFRINLEIGQFMQSYIADTEDGINAVACNQYHRVIGLATDSSTVELWDPRTRFRVGCIPVDPTESFNPVTSFVFTSSTGMAAGSNNGVVQLFDIRSTKPILTKQHQYELPIQSISFNDDIVMSTDSKVVKIWKQIDGTPMVSLESEHPINDACLFPDSGLVMLAVEDPKMQAYFIPELGPAPRWCYYLENMTEELEESNEKLIYDDYKFVVKKDLEALGLSHIIGTELLRPYMHGFFIDFRLFKRAQSVSDPLAFEKHQKEIIKRKIEAAREDRVKLAKLPKVNKLMALKLLQDEASKEASSSKKRKKIQVREQTKASLLADNRFSTLFTNPDLEINPDSEEYQRLNPMQSRDLEEGLREAEITRLEHGKSILECLVDKQEELKSMPIDATAAGEEKTMSNESDSSDDGLIRRPQKPKQTVPFKRIRRDIKKSFKSSVQFGQTPKDSIRRGRIVNYLPGEGRELSGVDTEKPLSSRIRHDRTNVRTTATGDKELTYTKFKNNTDSTVYFRQEAKKGKRSAGKLLKDLRFQKRR